MCINYKPESWEWLLLPAFTLRRASFVACLFLCFDMSMTFSRNSESIFSEFCRQTHTYLLFHCIVASVQTWKYVPAICIASNTLSTHCSALRFPPRHTNLIESNMGSIISVRASRKSTFTNSFSFLFSSFSFSLRMRIFCLFCIWGRGQRGRREDRTEEGRLGRNNKRNYLNRPTSRERGREMRLRKKKLIIF